MVTQATTSNLPSPTIFRLCAAFLVLDVPSALPNGKIVVLVSNSSSFRMEARTGAVDLRAEQRLE